MTAADGPTQFVCLPSGLPESPFLLWSPWPPAAGDSEKPKPLVRVEGYDSGDAKARSSSNRFYQVVPIDEHHALVVKTGRREVLLFRFAVTGETVCDANGKLSGPIDATLIASALAANDSLFAVVDHY